jgi:hypothetical protein
MNPTRHPHRFLSLFAALILAACASTSSPVQSMKDPKANFREFETFAWQGHGAQSGAQPVSILDNDIRAAITNELQQMGYAEATAGASPDLVLHFETAAADTTRSNPVRVGVGVGSMGARGGASVGVSSPSSTNVREGTLILRAVDPTRNAEVWNGRVSRQLGRGGPPDKALIQSAVSDLLEEFPARGNAPK